MSWNTGIVVIIIPTLHPCGRKAYFAIIVGTVIMVVDIGFSFRVDCILGVLIFSFFFTGRYSVRLCWLMLQ